MNCRKAITEDVNVLVELRKKQLIDEVGCQIARLHASSQGKGLYEKLGFTDIEGFMSKRVL